MYIATHLGWVVLSCAVLMFFRKRSIKKKGKKKKPSGILPSPCSAAVGLSPGPLPAGGCIKRGGGEGASAAGAAQAARSPLPGQPSGALPALVSVYPIRNWTLLSCGFLCQPAAHHHRGAPAQRVQHSQAGRSHNAQSQSVLQS